MKKKKYNNVSLICSFLALILCILSLIYYTITKKVPNVSFIIVILLIIGSGAILLENKKGKKKRKLK